MEDERIIDVDERTWKEKLHEKALYTKLRMQNVQKKVSKFYHENETVINSMAASAAVAVGGAVIKNVSSAARYHRDAKLEKDRKSRIWNPRTGSYIPLRRPMTIKEQIYYEHQVELGRPRIDVLYELGLLK